MNVSIELFNVADQDRTEYVIQDIDWFWVEGAPTPLALLILLLLCFAAEVLFNVFRDDGP